MGQEEPFKAALFPRLFCGWPLVSQRAFLLFGVKLWVNLIGFIVFPGFIAGFRRFHPSAKNLSFFLE